MTLKTSDGKLRLPQDNVSANISSLLPSAPEADNPFRSPGHGLSMPQSDHPTVVESAQSEILPSSIARIKVIGVGGGGGMQSTG